MKLVTFILNIPWTLIGLGAAFISLPKKFSINKNPFALIIYVRSFWFLSWMSFYKGVRGMALGNVVLLGRNSFPNDLEHELVHVRQSEKAPLVQPFLYFIETIKNGYKNNKYEVEAYSTTNSVYLGK